MSQNKSRQIRGIDGESSGKRGNTGESYSKKQPSSALAKLAAGGHWEGNRTTD